MNRIPYKENTDFQTRLHMEMSREEISLTPLQLRQFDLFYQMMIDRNKVMNLTSITEEGEVIRKHFLDSLSCAKIVDMNEVHSVIDIGTGAGFPGIPLKILYPDKKFVLADSLGKRIHFLEEVIEALGLESIEAVHERAEDLARKKEYRGRFDLCVSRAVANLSTLTEYCIPFVKVKGSFIAYKSQKGQKEVEQAGKCFRTLGCRIDQSLSFYLGKEEDERLLLRIVKQKETPKAFPRKAGIPSRNPL